MQESNGMDIRLRTMLFSYSQKQKRAHVLNGYSFSDASVNLSRFLGSVQSEATSAILVALCILKALC